MAVLTFYQPGSMINPYIWYGSVTSATSTQLSLNNYSGSYATYYGNNFSYSGNTVTGGTVTGYVNYRGYALEYTVSGANVEAKTLANLINSGSAVSAQAFALSGNDLIIGSAYADTLVGYFGDDLFEGKAGNDYLDGGPGVNTAIYSQSRGNYVISSLASGYQISGPEGIDTLHNIEYIRFSDGTISLASIDLVAPSIAGFSPADGASRIQTSQNITFLFSEAITKGAGIIYLRTGSASGPIAEQFNVSTSNRVSVSGNTLIIDPTSLLESTTYFVTMGSGVVKDLVGNNFTGITTYDFRTVTSVYDHIFTYYLDYGYGDRYETTDIKVPGTVILGSLGDDDLFGTAGVDYVAGYQGLDIMMTYGGDDVIYPSIVRSVGDAGDGIDTLVFTRSLSDSTIAPYLFQNPDAQLSKGVTVTRNGDSYSFASFNNVERLAFTDTMLALDTAANENAGNSYLLYQAAFDRTPDVEGLGYWISKVDSGANMVKDVAQNFILSNEFKSLYGANPTVPEFMGLLYQNVLNRSPDQEGLNYWLNEFALAGDSTLYRAGLLNNFAISAENIANVADQIVDGIQYQAYVG